MFEIQIHDTGIMCDVTKDRRAFLYDCDDLDEAIRLIRQREPRADMADVWVVDPDGYRTNLARHR